MIRRLCVSLLLTVGLATSGRAEPVIAFAYKDSFPTVQVRLILMNEAAARVNLNTESWGPPVLAIQDSLRQCWTDSLGAPAMLLTIFVENVSTSSDTLVFPGESEIGIVHNGHFITAARPVTDISIAPGERAVYFMVFHRYEMDPPDTLAIRPKESP